MNYQFVCKVRYTKTDDDGKLKRVAEEFMVHAPTFGGAEEEIYLHLGESIKGEFLVEAIKKVNFHDIFVHDDPFGDWFEVNVKYVSSDENTGKDKKVSNKFLTTAENAKDAYSKVYEILNDQLFDMDINLVKESKIMEVFEPSNKIDN